MRPVTFSQADLQMIACERYHHPDPRVQRKMEVLWLLHHHETHERAALLAGVSRSSVQRYLTDFLAGGLDLIRRCPHAGSVSPLDEQQHSLEEYFDQHPPHTVRQAQQVIEQRTGLRRGLTQVRRFLKRLGLKPRKACAIPVPPKSTPEEHATKQATFVQEQLEPRLAEARAGRRQVRFVDASHFVFATFLGYLWCKALVRAARPRVGNGSTSWGPWMPSVTIWYRLPTIVTSMPSRSAPCYRPWSMPGRACRSPWYWTTPATRSARW